MTFTTNNLIHTINMEERTVYVKETPLGPGVEQKFDYYNAEDCDSSEEVAEMIEEYYRETL